MLSHYYTCRNNDVLRCIYLLLANKYGFKKTKNLRSHSVQKVTENERAKIRIDIKIKIDILIKIITWICLFIIRKKMDQLWLRWYNKKRKFLIAEIKNEKI
ncbi:hypothetical protein TCON_1972 [Astathelohania contejeani]|uniref:Uncharacterized protein n=1 Tax=Astathelohania contejeani TaxID=164912 RepID=A0ABQ7HXC9_9MICR|nr:hypothetical protein TCON_1972 [Thelohania contejeani]